MVRVGGLDNWLTKFPGGPQVKIVGAVTIIMVATAYPIFKTPKEGTGQGQHYFSQERPEQIVKAQERDAKEYKEQRKARQVAKEEQQKK